MGGVKKTVIVLALILFLISFRFVSELGIDKGPESRFIVRDIIDGDTFELDGGDRLRLTGIDCPERGDPFYDSAVILASDLVFNKSINIEFSRRRRDGYGRLLGYVYLDTLFVNRELVRNGLAHIYLFKDNVKDDAHIQILLAAQNEAMDNRRGIWSREYFPESNYVSSRTSFRFHRPHCRSVKDLTPDRCIKFDTREDAFRAGLSPCRNCRP